MSLIADALKRAQASQLGKRYVTTQPSGVLPMVGKSGGGGLKASLLAYFNGDQRNTTLVIGLASGTVFFLFLFFYFFYGPGRSVGTSFTRASADTQSPSRELVLAPPPSLAALEPIKLEEERAVPHVALTTGPGAHKSPAMPARARRGPIPQGAEKNYESAELVTSKVSVTSDLSEELRSAFNLALFYQEGKKLELARREYEKVVQRWPLYSEAHNNLGLVYKELGMQERAISEFRRALDLNPGYVRAHHNLGVVFHLRGDLKQAKENYLSALALDRENLRSLNNLGMVYREEKRFYDARKVLEKALGLDPDSAETRYNFALILEDLGDAKRAREHFEQFLTLAGPENSALAERVESHLRATATKTAPGN
jgi:Tfp pilus assembly protein PilF